MTLLYGPLTKTIPYFGISVQTNSENDTDLTALSVLHSIPSV